MKTPALALFALVALMFPVLSQAATVAQVEAWKAEFPAALPGDSASLHQMIAGYQQLVKQVTPTSAKKILGLLKDRLTHDQLTTNSILHPAKPNPKMTPAMQADATQASKWLNEKFAPFFARVPK